MNIAHIFKDAIGNLIDKGESLIISDVCVNCNFHISVDFVLNNNFNSNNYKYELISKLVPCLTEEEFVIKQLLE